MTSTILVAVDEPVLRGELFASLENAGFDVVVASAGEQARQLIETERIRLVISDWEMGDADTFQAIRQHFDDERQDVTRSYTSARFSAPVLDSSDYVSPVERASIVEGRAAGW